MIKIDSTWTRAHGVPWEFHALGNVLLLESPFRAHLMRAVLWEALMELKSFLSCARLDGKDCPIWGAVCTATPSRGGSTGTP